MAKALGRIIQIQGGVVDVEFAATELPDIYEALEIPVDGKLPMILEVQKHLGRIWFAVLRWIRRMVCNEACRFTQQGDQLWCRLANQPWAGYLMF